MSPFEFLSAGLSIVLGLAVTLLLTSLLTAFRARRRTRLSWLPFTWAAYVLIMQFDVWWEVYGLASLESWSVGAFVVLRRLDCRSSQPADWCSPLERTTTPPTSANTLKRTADGESGW